MPRKERCEYDASFTIPIYFDNWVYIYIYILDIYIYIYISNYIMRFCYMSNNRIDSCFAEFQLSAKGLVRAHAHPGVHDYRAKTD